MERWTRFSIALMVTLNLVLLSGCCRPQRCEDEQDCTLTYTERAYLKHQASESGPSSQNFDQQPLDPELLDLSDCDYTGEWERQPYETVDEWIDRLRLCMCANRDAINSLEKEYNELADQEREFGGQIRQLVSKNEKLREMKSQLQAEQTSPPDFRQLSSNAPPPFIVHFVRRGDTLYSISRKYYDSPAMINNILRWNGGWIRCPEELVAGLGLVLFTSPNDQTGQKVVENYIDSLEERME